MTTATDTTPESRSSFDPVMAALIEGETYSVESINGQMTLVRIGGVPDSRLMQEAKATVALDSGPDGTRPEFPTSEMVGTSETIAAKVRVAVRSCWFSKASGVRYAVYEDIRGKAQLVATFLYRFEAEAACGDMQTHKAIQAHMSALEESGMVVVPSYRTHEAADAFWRYWREYGETHKHGYYESTWNAINAALEPQANGEPPGECREAAPTPPPHILCFRLCMTQHLAIGILLQ